MDRKFLEFALGLTFTPGDVTINCAGGCRLNPQLAKAIAELSSLPEANAPVRQFLKNV